MTHKTTKMPIYNSKRFRESALAHQLLDGMQGIEVGGSAHNAFGLNTLNVDYTDDMNTVFKRGEVEMCGEAMPVDVVAFGDALPFPNKSFDFVISSHVIEHFWDPVKAINEWLRVAKRYVYIICPQPDADPGDVGLPLTTLDEFSQRHSGVIAPPEIDDHRHWSRWTCETFVAMCQRFGFMVVKTQDPDDKVGNGFTIVIDAGKSTASYGPGKYETPERGGMNYEKRTIRAKLGRVKTTEQ